MLVQLAIRMKRKVTSVVEDCKFTTRELQTKSILDIIPLGSYDIFIGMDWIELHHAILEFHNKVVTCLDEDVNYVQLKHIRCLITVREILAIQLKKYIRKGCQLYIIHAEEFLDKIEPCT